MGVAWVWFGCSMGVSCHVTPRSQSHQRFRSIVTRSPAV